MTKGKVIMSQKRLGFMIIHNLILTYGVDDVSTIRDLLKMYDR